MKIKGERRDFIGTGGEDKGERRDFIGTGGEDKGERRWSGRRTEGVHRYWRRS